MKKTQPPFFVIIAGLTTITAILWLVASVIISFRKEEVSPSIEEAILKPLSPVLNSASLDKLERRVFFENSFINERNILAPTIVDEETSTPEPTVSPIP